MATPALHNATRVPAKNKGKLHQIAGDTRNLATEASRNLARLASSHEPELRGLGTGNAEGLHPRAERGGVDTQQLGSAAVA